MEVAQGGRIASAHDVFREADVDQSGYLTLDEVERLVRRTHPHMNETQLRSTPSAAAPLRTRWELTPAVSPTSQVLFRAPRHQRRQADFARGVSGLVRSQRLDSRRRVLRRAARELGTGSAAHWPLTAPQAGARRFWGTGFPGGQGRWCSASHLWVESVSNSGKQRSRAHGRVCTAATLALSPVRHLAATTTASAAVAAPFRQPSCRRGPQPQLLAVTHHS